MPPFTSEENLSYETQEKLYLALRQLSPREQEGWLRLIAFLNHGEKEDVFRAVAQAVERTAYAQRKKRSDHVGNHRRRILVGAQVSRSLAARCRRCAELEGVTLYRWLVETLENATSSVGGARQH